MSDHKNIYIEVTTLPLNINKAYDFVADATCGAVNTFIGTVRNHHEGKAVTGISYDAHIPLAQSALKEICLQALEKWPNTRYYVRHFKGYLSIGGISVMIAVSAAHRVDSFEACRFVIDMLKKRAPIWKKEHYIDGQSQWLSGYSLKSDQAENDA